MTAELEVGSSDESNRGRCVAEIGKPLSRLLFTT